MNAEILNIQLWNSSEGNKLGCQTLVYFSLSVTFNTFQLNLYASIQPLQWRSNTAVISRRLQHQERKLFYNCLVSAGRCSSVLFSSHLLCGFVEINCILLHQRGILQHIRISFGRYLVQHTHINWLQRETMECHNIVDRVVIWQLKMSVLWGSCKHYA